MIATIVNEGEGEDCQTSAQQLPIGASILHALGSVNHSKRPN